MHERANGLMGHEFILTPVWTFYHCIFGLNKISLSFHKTKLKLVQKKNFGEQNVTIKMIKNLLKR